MHVQVVDSVLLFRPDALSALSDSISMAVTVVIFGAALAARVRLHARRAALKCAAQPCPRPTRPSRRSVR